MLSFCGNKKGREILTSHPTARRGICFQTWYSDFLKKEKHLPLNRFFRSVTGACVSSVFRLVKRLICPCSQMESDIRDACRNPRGAGSSFPFQTAGSVCFFGAGHRVPLLIRSEAVL